MKKKLLVLDDEPDICDLIVDVAEELGFTTCSTDKSLDFPLLYSNDLDCIVMDLAMPDFDGIEVIRFLGDNKCKAAILLVSGMDESIISTANRLARDHGLNVLGALSKPIKITVLEGLLSQVITPPVDTQSTAKPPCAPCAPDEVDFPDYDGLKEALIKRQVQPYFQPQVSAINGQLLSTEALARWVHPTRGIIAPHKFIDFAEDNNLMDELTFCIFDQVLDHMADWKNNGMEIGCSINFSAKSLSNLDLPDILFARALKKGITTNFLTIEITESAVLGEGKQYLDVLTRLRMKGFKLSIDDFGTGYSSMKHLRDIPFNEVKIDRSFVMNVLNEESAKSIVQSTTDLAHQLSMSIVAEGVEDTPTLNFLKTLGCDLIQGYICTPPLSSSNFMDWVHNWTEKNIKQTGF